MTGDADDEGGRGADDDAGAVETSDDSGGRASGVRGVRGVGGSEAVGCP